MPSEIVFYFKNLPKNYNGKKTYHVVYETPGKDYCIIKKTLNVYDSETLTKKIGVASVTYTTYTIIDVNNEQYNTIIVNTIIIFNDNTSFPNGNDNILVFDATYLGDIYSLSDLSSSNFALLDGFYKSVINTSLSTGEYANQVGYRETVKDVSKNFVKNTVYFPLPIVTYTNAFNSLPQPSTAPLPS
jgi:hypothetical protein